MSDTRHEIAREQAYVDGLYARLDALREATSRRLAGVRRSSAGGTHQNRSERDAFAQLAEDRLARLNAVEDRLCFGRLDLGGDRRRYVGRLGLADEERNQLLVDWRAPAAQPFYSATAASPGGVVRRRHLVTRGRSVTGVEDEVFDLDHLAEADRGTLGGEGALLAALEAHRSGRMRDIVATIQAEQDEVIRSDLAGVLVVQGGPGTGKTAVGLHRAAYLLYTYRDRLARSGVLLVGPNATFLRYIGQVLPSLGETGVVMSTLGDLLPGVTAVAEEDDRVAALKGDPRMADVVLSAVRARQRVPEQPVRLTVEGREIVLQPDVVAAARTRARRSRRPHNAARTGFLTRLLERLAAELARALGAEVDDDNRDEFLDALRESREVRRTLNLLWMPLTPQQVISDLFADPVALERAATRLTRAERDLLHRDRGAAWTPADVPLLDEAAELLGDDDVSAALAERQEAEERRRHVEYAQAVLESSGGTDDLLAGLVTPESLAERFSDTGPALSVAERAAQDRTWAFGHVVVDEAQELSPMAWRLLMRRCPSRSMTVVGDLAQTGSLAGAQSWEQVFDPYVAGRWRLKELSVNYRTPRQVMDVAAAVLAGAGPAEAPATKVVPPRSAREGHEEPTAHPVAQAGDLPARVAAVVAADLDRLGDGRLAVITPRDLRAPVTRALAATLPPGSVADRRAALDAPVTVLAVAEAKGLEVDTVVLVEPAAILAGSSRGAHDLYVALTRPTQRLRVVHHAPLPAGMTGMAAVAPADEPAGSTGSTGSGDGEVSRARAR